MQTVPSEITVPNGSVSQPPLFDSINNTERFYNFRLKDNSPAKDAGINAGVAIDLDGKARPPAAGYDLGAYEKQ